jgi:hypothetical protein
MRDGGRAFALQSTDISGEEIRGNRSEDVSGSRDGNASSTANERPIGNRVGFLPHSISERLVIKLARRRQRNFSDLAIVAPDRIAGLMPRVTRICRELAAADLRVLALSIPYCLFIISVLLLVIGNFVFAAAVYLVAVVLLVLVSSGSKPGLEAKVTYRLLRFLEHLDSKSAQWQQPQIKQQLVSELEKAAKLVRKRLPYTAGRLDANTNFHLHMAASKIAWWIRRKKLWIAMPKSDTCERLAGTVVEDLEFAVMANWDAWTLHSEDHMIVEDPGYRRFLDEEQTRHQAHKANVRRVLMRAGTTLAGLALLGIPVLVASNSLDWTEAAVAFAGTAGVAIIGRGSAAGEVKDFAANIGG